MKDGIFAGPAHYVISKVTGGDLVLDTNIRAIKVGGFATLKELNLESDSPAILYALERDWIELSYTKPSEVEATGISFEAPAISGGMTLEELKASQAKDLDSPEKSSTGAKGYAIGTPAEDSVSETPPAKESKANKVPKVEK